MKRVNYKKIYAIVKRNIAFFLSMFAVYVVSYMIITSLIFNQFMFPMNYIWYMCLIALIISLILNVILSFDKLNFIVQSLLIYLTITISIYVVGFFTNIFTRDISFWIFSLVINLVGLCILLGIVIIRRILENKDLNAKLKDFQEKDNL